MALHRALREAVRRLGVASAAVYLLDDERSQIRVAMIGGNAPSLFTFPGRMGLDAPYASARALASESVAVLAEPDLADADQEHVLPYPYIALSAPVIAADHRFGSLTVLRPETHGSCEAEICTGLKKIADDLAMALAELADSGTVITPGHMPALVPVFDGHASTGTTDWGCPASLVPRA